MRSELEELPKLKFRQEIPKAHRQSLDTRLRWLWNQRFGTVQNIYTHSKDLQDNMACTLILQAVMAKDLGSIELLMYRIEGGAVVDQEEAERKTGTLPI